MLGDDHQRRRHDDQDRGQVIDREDGLGHGEDGRRNDGAEVDRAGNPEVDDHRQHVADDDAHQHRQRRKEAAKQQRAEHHHAECDERDRCRHAGRVMRAVLLAAREGHVGGDRRQAEADQRHDHAHRRRRQDDVQPLSARPADDERDDDEDQAGDREAADRMLKPQRRRRRGGDAGEGRRDEGEARAEERRRLAPADEQVDQRADAVHQQNQRRVDDRRPRLRVEQDRHQHRRAEHREQVLQAQRYALEDRNLLFHLNDRPLHDRPADRRRPGRSDACDLRCHDAHSPLFCLSVAGHDSLLIRRRLHGGGRFPRYSKTKILTGLPGRSSDSSTRLVSRMPMVGSSTATLPDARKPLANSAMPKRRNLTL